MESINKRTNIFTAITRIIGFFLVVAVIVFIAGCQSTPKNSLDLDTTTWSELENEARGKTVNMMMWTGDAKINEYMSGYVQPELQKRYGIDLSITPGQGSTIVSILMGEMEAGKGSSEIDLIWINGETFYQLRSFNALFGPFLQKLPNSQYLNLDNPFIKYDFQQPIDGYEAPWGNVQMALIYDTARTKHPPKNMEQLRTFVAENPGEFTFSSDFAGMTFLKSLLIGLAGKGNLSGPFDEDKYEKYSTQLWEYINTIKSDFWKDGETFPADIASMHQMFVSGELALTMSNNDAEVDNKVLEGFFPKTSKAYVLESGTIQNSHYLGIPVRAADKKAALVAINFMISPVAQYQKLKPSVWGDGTVLDIDQLPAQWRKKFQSVPGRNHAPPREEINQKALQELAPEYMIRIYEDFRSHVVQQ